MLNTNMRPQMQSKLTQFKHTLMQGYWVEPVDMFIKQSIKAVPNTKGVIK